MIGTKVQSYYDSQSKSFFGNSLAKIQDAIDAIHKTIMSNPDKQAACDKNKTTYNASVAFLQSFSASLLGAVKTSLTITGNGTTGAPLGDVLCQKIYDGYTNFKSEMQLCFLLANETLIGKCLQTTVSRKLSFVCN